MLFPYKYVEDHPIYTLQKWMDELFLNVWCKADPAVDYDIDLLPDDIKEITLAIYNDGRITTDYFYGPIETVYKIFQDFDDPTKAKLETAYRNNNNVEDLCKQQNGCSPFFYSELLALNEPLKNAIKTMYDRLFESVIHLKAVTDKLGCTMYHHYDEFVKENDEGKCPFCAINDIKGKYSSKHEAYDHYLPKGDYPFNSINFLNLSLMCHECNSTYKLKFDPLHEKLDPLHRRVNKTRRKAFYPFDSETSDLSLSIELKKNTTKDLKPEDIDLTIESPGKNEEVESWLDVFGIDERYKEKCLEKQYGKYWLLRVTDEYENNYPEKVKAVFSQAEFVQQEIEEAERNRLANANLIKAAYLKACVNNGILPSTGNEKKGCLNILGLRKK